MQLKLIRIINCRGFPHLHFEIHGKMYFYGIRGIKKDYTMVLKCWTKFSRDIYLAPHISRVESSRKLLIRFENFKSGRQMFKSSNLYISRTIGP